MAVILAPVLRQLQAFHPDIFTVTYIDDRTCLCPTVADLDVVNNVWSTLESFLRLRTNEEKSQIWARSPEALAKLDNTHYSSNASFTMQVLGATLGSEERALSDRERDTLQDVARRSRRIACLPVSARLKGRLAATVLGPKAVWGHVINGRCPTQKDNACFFRHFKAATSDNRFVKGRSSMDLKRAFFFGHTCDLAFYGALRTISSGFAWARHCASLGENCRWSQSTVVCLNSILQDLGWCAHSNAVGQSGVVPCLHFGAVKAEVDKCLHHIRDAWRLKKVRQWLLHRTRIDSGIGRDTNLIISEPLIKKVRSILRECDAHVVSVACGGFQTVTLDFERLHQGVAPVQQCPYCLQLDVPGVIHVLWSCQAFSHLRLLPQPECPLASRIGWSSSHQVTKDLLVQMGKIRAAEAARRLAPVGAG